MGATVIILGNDLTATTGVSFNGTAAAFTVVSNTEITTTVPAGATTGTVEVSTPIGTLNSNATFQVLSPWILKNSSQITEYSSSRSHSCAPMNVTAGGLLLSYNIVYTGATSGITLTNSDTQGNVWTVIQTETIPNISILQIQYARAKASGSDTIKVSSSANVHNLGNGCEEWSGGVMSGPILDGSAGINGAGRVASASAKTTGSSDLVVGFCTFPWDNGANFAMSAGAGYYTQDLFNNYMESTSVYGSAAEGEGKQTASCMTSGPASNWSAIIAAFRY
ncbi:MAG TPA: IPT/TIG domain-containing protein, partial [Terriglobales bacterium]|nr:IPT/TIG domain-containing protein [Terriglobales bacterium]